MSAIEKPVKLNLGFHGGQVLSVRVQAAELTRLRSLLGTGSGWHELATDSGKVVFDLGKLDYMLVDDDSHRIGF